MTVKADLVSELENVHLSDLVLRSVIHGGKLKLLARRGRDPARLLVGKDVTFMPLRGHLTCRRGQQRFL